jgi:predicted permease
MWRRRRALERLDQDIRDHIERETQDYIDRGLPPDEAHRRAMLAFGNVALTKEDARAVWLRPWLEQTRQDLRYALRMLRRTPGFTTIVVLTLALGIGANTTIFSLFEAVMMRTLAIHAPEELYVVAHGARRAVPGSNYPYFERIRGRTDIFAGVTAYLRNGSVKVATANGIETAPSLIVSGNYYAVLGVPMALGRGFSSEDDRGGAETLVAVISDGYWSRKFGRDPAVLGRTLSIDGRPTTLVGVTAPGFAGLDPGTGPDITLPMAVRTLDAPHFLTSHETWYGDMPILARLQPGVTDAQAAAVVDAVFQQYRSEPDNTWLFRNASGPPVRASLMPAGRGTTGLRDEYATSLQLLMAMVGVVLLIGCANVANLLLARGHARAKEVAVRMSIGAGRLRLIRQFLTESMLLALLGGALGFALARMGIDAIGALVGSGPNPIQLDLHPNATVLTFTIVISVLTGMLFGLAPAVGCTRVNLSPGLKASGTAMARPGRRWSTRQVLVAAQIALCVLLVSGATLLARTLWNLEKRENGFNRHNLLLFSLDARRTGFPVEQVPALCDALIDRFVQRGGVTSGSCSRNIPVNSRGNARPLDVPGAAPHPLNERFVFMNMVTPEYFRTFGIGVAGGRVFDARDSANGERVAVVNRALVRFFFGADNPVGRTIHFYNDDGRPMTIVGVVDDATQRSLREEAPMTVYTPLAQLREPEALVTMALRTEQDPLAVAVSVRGEVRAASPDVVVDYIRSMEQQIGTVLVRERLVAMLSSAFGMLALVLSCIGLYGVVSYEVTRSLRDLGVRMALGAQRVDVIWQVLRSGLAVSSIGVVAGVAAAIAATGLLSTLLFGITARDPVTLAGAAVLLMLTTLAASFLPARRASRIDPVLVLRAE